MSSGTYSFNVSVSNGENLRGEERWEKNVKSCLTQAGWALSSRPDISISFVRPEPLRYFEGAKLYVFNTWFGLMHEHIDTLKELQGSGAKVCVTGGYKQNFKFRADITSRLGLGSFRILPPPIVEKLYLDRDAESNVLVWHSRDIPFTFSLHPAAYTNLRWVRDCMINFPEMVLKVLCGSDSDIPEVEALFEGLNIEVYGGLDWQEVHHILAGARMVVNAVHRGVGSLVDAVAHGHALPIFSYRFDPFDCPRAYLTDEATMTDLLTEIFFNKTETFLIHSLQRKAVEKKYTYSAFAQNFLELANDYLLPDDTK